MCKSCIYTMLIHQRAPFLSHRQHSRLFRTSFPPSVFTSLINKFLFIYLLFLLVVDICGAFKSYIFLKIEKR